MTIGILVSCMKSGRGTDRFQRARGNSAWACGLHRREDETAARLIGHDGANVSALDRSAPARAACLRMRDENAGTDLVKKRGDRARDDSTSKGPVFGVICR